MKILTGIIDHLDPEVQAMVIAKYSRDYGPIEDRIPSSKESVEEHKQKLGRFYVGYNHKSVGQLGVTTIFLEGVSQLAAKAIENHPLYNGQESSTRYINFSNQPMYSDDYFISEWQEKWRAFYIKALPEVINKIRLEYPFKNQFVQDFSKGDNHLEESIQKYENTVKARAFDICRGLLPAGCTTNAAFQGTFDTINDHFGEMLYHPCKEMRDIAEEVLSSLAKKYPYAAIPMDKLRKRNEYVTNEFFYQTDFATNLKSQRYVLLEGNSDGLLWKKHERAPFQKLPRHQSNGLRVTMCGFLDFGSYRDLQRHRNGYLKMDILSPTKGFNMFYMSNLPSHLQLELAKLVSDYSDFYHNDKTLSAFDKQYCTPMGYDVGVEYNCDINQALYIMELRSAKTVHQTLRHLVQDWAKSFQQKTLGIMKVHVDMDFDNFTLKRGEQA